MPSGKVHDRITVAAAVAAVPLWWACMPPVQQPKDVTEAGALVAATLFSGLLLSPDLDLDSSIYRRWGPFRFLWWPYQKAMPHRSALSHSFVIGPALRLIYFLLVTWALFRIGTWVAGFFVPIDRNGLSRQYTDAFIGFWRSHPRHLQMTALGLFLGTGLHVLADILVTGFKRRF
jgi:uncharacterized metal-binding protein